MGAYEDALKRARGNLAHCDDAAVMASLCDGTIQLCFGAGLSGRLAWEGAMAKGLTSQELMALGHQDSLNLANLMWEGETWKAAAAAEHELENRVS
jgi:hypothetical protein